ncbi:MAG: peptidylprolyl isomerase [Thermoleophilia bacterium]
MKRAFVAVMMLLALVSVFAVTGCGEKEVPAGAIAAVGDAVVTQEQFDAIIAQAKAQYKAQDQEFPAEDSAEYKQMKAMIVEYLVQAELVSQAATEKGVSVTTDEIDERIKTIVEQVGGQKKYEALLKEQGVSEDDLRQQLQVQMLQDALYAKIGEDVTVTDEEVRAFYDDDANQDQFVVADTVTARHVLVKTKAEAEKVRALLEADSSDANWKKVAKKYSTDPGSKNVGGDLGTFPKGRMVAEFEDAAFALDVDEISKPVKTEFGWHIIQVTAKTKGSTTSFEDAKDGIEEQLKLQKQSEAWDAWLEEAKAEAEIVYAAGFNPTELTASPTPSETTTSPAASPSPSASE